MRLTEHLPLLFKIGCGVDVTNGTVNYTLIMWYLFSHLSIMIASLLSVAGHPLMFVIQSETSYGLLGILLVVINISVVVLNRHKIATLVSYLTEPFKSYKQDTSQSKIVRQYFVSNNVVGHITIVLLTVICASRILYPLAQMLNIVNANNTEGLPLPFGSGPWSQKPDLFYMLCFLISSTALVSSALSHICWYLTFIYSSFLVTTKLKLLVFELRELDDQAKDLCEDLITPFHYLRRLKAEKYLIMAKCNMRCLKNVILEHNKIIRQVKELDGSFQFIVLFYNNMAVLIIVLCINLIIQSEYLHRSLYYCSWVNKCKDFRNSLLIMMIVANRPLRLTAGGTYILNMESFNKAASGVYSYLNILISLKK